MPNHWSQVEICGKPLSMFHPDSTSPFTVLWLADQDNDIATRDRHLTAVLNQFRLRAIVPHGAKTWWVDRVCAEFDRQITGERFLLDHVVPWLATHGSVSANAIAVAGVGCGGQAAIRLAFRNPVRFRVAASMNGALDFHDWHGRGTTLDAMYATREQARQDTAILQLDPVRWPPHLWFGCDPASPWYRGNDRLHEKLAAYGVPHIAELEHPPTVDAMLQFVVNGLLRESRRLM